MMAHDYWVAGDWDGKQVDLIHRDCGVIGTYKIGMSLHELEVLAHEHEKEKHA